MNSEILSLFRQSRLPASKYDTYFPAYDELFSKFKGKNITFVEVGILGGGSIEAFKKYFGSKSRIIGVDLNPMLKPYLELDGYEIFIGDQADPKFWENFYQSVGKIDILLDDGGHTNNQTWMTLKSAIPYINDGGLVVIEDTHASYMADFTNPSNASFLSRVKSCIDEINYRSSKISPYDRTLKKTNDIEKLNLGNHVHSIRIYESIVAFSIDSRLCKISQVENFGSKDNLPSGVIPSDFREKGLSERIDIVTRIVKKIRKILFKAINQ